jgi:type I restriction enzyme S subunit
MNKSAEKDLVPELRFPEFKNDAEWNVKPFSKIFEIGGGKDHKHLPSGDIPVYGSGGYMRSVNDFLYDGESACIGRKGTINNPMFLTGKFWTVDTLFYTHSFKNCLPKFVFSLFQNINWLEYNEAGGVPSLSKVIINSIKVGIPPKIKEQQKIADCLSSLDELVSANSQKLDALKAHKKGLMQQLFPAEDETIPKLRFPEFLGSDDWNKGCIDDLANLVMGNAFKSADFVCKGLQLIRMGNLYQGTLQLSRTPVYLPRSFEKEYSKFVVKPLDLLMSMTGTAGKEDYGYVVQVPKGSSYFMLNQRVVKVIPKKECVKEFLLQLLKSDNFLKSLYSLPGGTKQANLSAAQLKGLITMFPTPKEQQKIADCLSRLDELITAQKQKIESLKTHKKGLMQQLFPSAENGHMDAKAKVGA